MVHNGENLIRKKRKMAATNIKIQAKRMKSLSLSKHPVEKIGETM